MAGGGDQSDNPVAINVVPMVDVIFCLCVFFMCSFRFKQLEGKFESWLPKGKGNSAGDPGQIQEIRIAMFWDGTAQKTKRQFGHREVSDDGELESLIRGASDDFKKLGQNNAPVIIDGAAGVPWKEVFTVVNIAKRLQIDNIEFALGQVDKP